MNRAMTFRSRGLTNMMARLLAIVSFFRLGQPPVCIGATNPLLVSGPAAHAPLADSPWLYLPSLTGQHHPQACILRHTDLRVWAGQMWGLSRGGYPRGQAMIRGTARWRREFGFQQIKQGSLKDTTQCRRLQAPDSGSVSYTHLTLPTKA